MVCHQYVSNPQFYFMINLYNEYSQQYTKFSQVEMVLVWVLNLIYSIYKYIFLEVLFQSQNKYILWCWVQA